MLSVIILVAMIIAYVIVAALGLFAVWLTIIGTQLMRQPIKMSVASTMQEIHLRISNKVMGTLMTIGGAITLAIIALVLL